MWTNRPDSTWNGRSELKIASSFDRLRGSEQLLDQSSEQHLKHGQLASSNLHTRNRWSTDLQNTDAAHGKRSGNSKVLQRFMHRSALATTEHTLEVGSYAVNVQSVVATSEVSSTISLSGAPTASAGDWFSQTFYDANISNMVRSLYGDDGMISRNDMITTFRAVEQDNVVSTYEFSDLRTLVADGNLLHMPDYVRVLSTKVVGSNAANVAYQGSALGNLQVGSSGGQLEALVGKWFFGADHPSSFIPAIADSPARAIGYGWASGSLFGNDGKVNLTDIQQGDLGDCYFLASLGATLIQHTAAIQNMFTDNGDGTFAVRLFPEHDGAVAQTPDYVTVDRYLPVNVYDSSVSSWGQRFAYYDNQRVGLWVALAEKAYAQFAEEGYSQRPTTSAGYTPNSYGNIEGGFGFRTMPTLTGMPASYLSNAPSLQAIASALSRGYAMTADTRGRSDAVIDPYTGIVGNHEYTIVNANLSSRTLTLYNPWGDTSTSTSPTGDNQGFKVISYSDFVNYNLALINYC